MSIPFSMIHTIFIKYSLSSAHSTMPLASQCIPIKNGWKGLTVQQLSSLNIVPHFTLQDLRTLCCGPYVLSLAIPYFQHANRITYRRHSSHPNIVQIVGMISRHSRNNPGSITQYKIYHHFTNNFLETISYCSCDCGTRTAGLCSHMTASLGNMIDLYFYKDAWKALRGDMDGGI